MAPWFGFQINGQVRVLDEDAGSAYDRLVNGPYLPGAAAELEASGGGAEVQVILLEAPANGRLGYLDGDNRYVEGETDTDGTSLSKE